MKICTMATFSEMIKSKAVQSTFLKKQAVVAELKRQLQKIKALDTEVPNARSFHRVEVAANNSVEALKEASRELNMLLYKGNPDVEADEDYVADQKLTRDAEFKLFNAIDEYIDILTAKEIKYPPVMGNVPPASPTDLSDILAQLVKCQTDNAKATSDQLAANAKVTADQLAANASQHKETILTLSKHGTHGPKAAQPFFQPRNNDSDYQLFSEFIQKFDNFVLKCKNDVRLQWLKSSVKGDALMLIKHLSATDDNFKLARDRLIKRYNNSEVLKHNLL